jgi:hypothetical protein
MKEWETDYKLIPMSEITEEAREIAVRWVEGYEPKGFDLPGKHKLASDIMNYARRSRDKEVADLRAKLATCILEKLHIQNELSEQIKIKEALKNVMVNK